MGYANKDETNANCVAVKRAFFNKYGSFIVINHFGCAVLPAEVVDTADDLMTKTGYTLFAWGGNHYNLYRVVTLAALTAGQREALANLPFSLEASHLCGKKCIGCACMEPSPWNLSRRDCHENPGHLCIHKCVTGVPCFVRNNRALSPESIREGVFALQRGGRLDDANRAQWDQRFEALGLE